MANLLGGLKDLLFEDEKPKTVVPPPTASVAAAPAPAFQVAAPVPAAAAAAPDDAEFVKAVNERLEAKELQVYDYLKFIRSVTGLASVIPDEKTRFVTAFVTVQTGIKVSKENLASTSAHYLTVVEEVRSDFRATIEKQRREKVEQNESTIAQMDADLQAKQDQIAKLTREIVAAKQQRDELAGKVAESKAKLENAKAASESACDKVVAGIKENVDKINRYLT